MSRQLLAMAAMAVFGAGAAHAAGSQTAPSPVIQKRFDDGVQACLAAPHGVAATEARFLAAGWPAFRDTHPEGHLSMAKSRTSILGEAGPIGTSLEVELINDPNGPDGPASWCGFSFPLADLDWAAEHVAQATGVRRTAGVVGENFEFVEEAGQRHIRSEADHAPAQPVWDRFTISLRMGRGQTFGFVEIFFFRPAAMERGGPVVVMPSPPKTNP